MLYHSWNKRELKQLWEDLMDLYEHENSHNHFLDSIVTMPTISVPEGVTKYLLIDGQQRLGVLIPLLFLVVMPKASADSKHCDRDGWPACYDLGYHKGVVDARSICKEQLHESSS